MKSIQNTDIQPFNTFNLSAIVDQLISLESIEDILNNFDFPLKNIKILGGGSNILLTQPLNTTVLKVEIKGIKIVENNENEVIVKVASGEVWHQFVLWALDHNYYGIENLSLIPGTVGASPIQNIGAYGVEIKDVIEKVEALNLETGKINSFNNEECQFGYRDSIFKSKYKDLYLITNVYFKLQKQPNLKIGYGDVQQLLEKKEIFHPTPKGVSNVIISIRQSKLPDPKEIGNAGSFFKNPVITKTLFQNIVSNYSDAPSYPIDNEHVKIPAGWLIEKCGWKGYRYNNYGVHPKQALVLVNYGGASGKEILDLAKNIQNDIHQKMGIWLDMEVNVW